MAILHLPSRTLLVEIMLYSLAASQSKRGLGYMGDTKTSDNDLLFSDNSLVSWYFTWSLNVATAINSSVPFVPLVHDVEDASNSDLTSRLNKLPSSSKHLLTFNEPDGTIGSGGSFTEPKDAAQSYIDNIVPLRTWDRAWKISHPSVTGSNRGIDWLRQFNDSCFYIDDNGCPADFVAVHWYGMASWLGTLKDFYNPENSSSDSPELKMWITEMALPHQDEDKTLSMLNQSINYLDGLDYIDAYAWFGTFRPDQANEWTGDNVALLDADGGLTGLGALYLGGEQAGFKEGIKGEGNSAPISRSISAGAVITAVLIMVFRLC